MKMLTDEEVVSTRNIVETVLARNGIEQWVGDMFNPYLFEVKIHVSVGMKKAVKTFNDLFHAMGILPSGDQVQMGEGRDYCACCVDEDGDTYSTIFNHPRAMEFKEGDEEYQFTLKAIHDKQESEAIAEEEEMRELVEGIKAGRLKSKTSDNYLMLAGEPYDEIAAGRKTVEYRDFTKYILMRTIGIKTIRFNRGTVKNAPHMQWEVKKVVLMDYDGNECDPFNVPDEFWPTTVAIHLGKRLA